jgi:hypothetical protein
MLAALAATAWVDDACGVDCVGIAVEELSVDGMGVAVTAAIPDVVAGAAEAGV